jgi:hypothetical protein
MGPSANRITWKLRADQPSDWTLGTSSKNRIEKMAKGEKTWMKEISGCLNKQRNKKDLK